MSRHWGQAALALAVAGCAGLGLATAGYAPFTAALSGVVAYALVRWLLAWVVRVRAAHATSGSHSQPCPQCRKRIRRQPGDWVLRCYHCGWRRGRRGLRFLRHSVVAAQLRRATSGPTLALAVVAVLLVGSGATAGVGVSELQETVDSLTDPGSDEQTDPADATESTDPGSDEQTDPADATGSTDPGTEGTGEPTGRQSDGEEPTGGQSDGEEPTGRQSDREEPTGRQSDGGEPTGGQSDGGESTSGEPAAAEVENPWDRKTVSVAVTEEASAAVENGTRLAVEYWNTEGGDDATYEFEFEYLAGSSAADIVVEPTAYPLECGREVSTAAIGCAPVLGPDATAEKRTTVEVVEHIPQPAARATVKHELGHVLGLGHDDEPRSLMSHEATLTGYQRTVVDSTDTRKLERQVERQLNAKRREAGLRPLSGNATLRTVARNRAAELLDLPDSGTVSIDPALGLGCEVELDGSRYLPGGAADLYATQTYGFHSATGTRNYSRAEYTGPPSDAVDQTVSRWEVSGETRDRAEHYNRQGVGIRVGDDGTFAAVRAIC